MEQAVRINKYLPIIIIYFFFNSVFLPSGLLYTAILTPLLLIWLFDYKTFFHLLWFFVFTIPFVFIHFINGVETSYYITSYVLLFTCYVFSLCFYQFLINCSTLPYLFRKIVIINAILVVIACIVFFIPAWRPAFWLTGYVSAGLKNFARLKLLTYEPSYYCTLLVPIAMYYYLKMLLFKISDGFIVFILLTVPLVLSFSLSILLGIPIALAILFILHRRLFFVRPRFPQYIIISVFLVVVAFILLYVIYPGNPLFKRIGNLFSGRDSSFRGRAFESYYLAWEVAKMKSIAFGVGLGQVKVLGLDLWRHFYNFKFGITEVTIPCAVADTLAVFGIAGVFLRISVQIFFFFYTKVYRNYYRLALFIFIFIYQFTGSYLYNIAEFVIWIFAFTNTFPEFDKKNSAFNARRRKLSGQL